MQTLLLNMYQYMQSYDWDNPMTFGIVVLVMLAFFGKWRYIFLSVLTYILAMLAHDFIVINIESMHEVVSLSNAIYVVGGGLFLLLSFVGFVKYMLSS